MHDSRVAVPHESEADVVRLRTADREFIIVGTAHVSRHSTDLVRSIIASERPDRVCVELDARRFEALARRGHWESLNLRRIIRQKQLATLLVNLLLASYQRKIGDKLGVIPGSELLEATRVAEEHGIPFDLCDRDVRTTMLRAWRSMSLTQQWKLLGALLAGLFDGSEISEEDLRELRKRDVLSELMEELAAGLPTLKRVLIDERDVYLAEKVRAAEGRRVVAVVGAGHVEGMVRVLAAPPSADLAAMERIPPVWPVTRWIGWSIPVAIVAGIGALAWAQGAEAARDNLVYWTLAHGIPSGLGAVLALSHPLTVVAAFLAAPVTSLSPVIGAGYVTAAVQAWADPPLVRDFETVAEDAGRARRWWSNRVLKVLLAFVLPTLGSMLGTYLGGYRLFTSLF